MEVEYGVGVANRYAFLYDKEDTDEDLSPKKLASAKKPTAKDALTSGGKSKVAPIPKNGKSVDKKAKVTSTIPAKEIKANVAGKGRKEETNKENLKAGPLSRRDERFPNSSSRVANDGYQQARTRDGGMPRRNFRDGGRYFYERAGEKQPPRELNGHVQELSVGKSEEKKDERTDVTTGTDEKVDENGVEAKNNDGPVETQTEKVQNGTGGAGDSNNPVVEEEEEEITLTLAEWRALQGPREKPKFNIRKPGEGEGRLGKLVPKKKEDELSEEENVYEVEEEVYYPQRAGKQKLVSDVGFRYRVPRRTRIYGHQDYIRFERNRPVAVSKDLNGKSDASKDPTGKDGAIKDPNGNDAVNNDLEGKDGAGKDLDGEGSVISEQPEKQTKPELSKEQKEKPKSEQPKAQMENAKPDQRKGQKEIAKPEQPKGQKEIAKPEQRKGQKEIAKPEQLKEQKENAKPEQRKGQKEIAKPEQPKGQKEIAKPEQPKGQKEIAKPEQPKGQKENAKPEQPKGQRENFKPWENKQEVTMTEEEKERKKILDYLRIKQQSLRPRRRNPRYVNIEDGYAFPTLG